MAKRIECPNCGAPATAKVDAGSFNCGYCGSLVEVSADGIHKPGLAEADALLQALANSHVSAQLKADFQSGLRTLDAHLRTRSHNPSVLRPRWLTAWCDTWAMRTVWGSAAVGLALVVAGSAANSEAMKAFGLVLFVVLPIVLAIGQSVLVAAIEPAFPSVPNLDWHLKAQQLAHAQMEIADKAEIEFTWPGAVPATADGVRALVAQAEQAAPTRARSFTGRLVAVVAVGLLLVGLVGFQVEKFVGYTVQSEQAADERDLDKRRRSCEHFCSQGTGPEHSPDTCRAKCSSP